MYQVEGFHRISSFDDTRDIYLTCALTDHLDVHITLRERREHPARNADHIPHLLPHQAQDRHVPVYAHL